MLSLCVCFKLFFISVLTQYFYSCIIILKYSYGDIGHVGHLKRNDIMIIKKRGI